MLLLINNLNNHIDNFDFWLIFNHMKTIFCKIYTDLTLIAYLKIRAVILDFVGKQLKFFCYLFSNLRFSSLKNNRILLLRNQMAKTIFFLANLKLVNFKRN